MKLDLTELSLGIDSELQKRAMQPYGFNAMADAAHLAAPAVAHAAPAVAETAAHVAAPAIGKAVGKSLLKSIPFANIFNGAFALNDLRQGDYVGAGLNVLGMVPGLGIPANLAYAVRSLKRQKQEAQPAQPQQQMPQYAPQPQIPQPPQNDGLYDYWGRSTAFNHTPGTVGSWAKTASIAPMIARALASRTINNTLDAEIANNKPVATTHPMQVELVAAHPEMAEILKDEKNKAYLESLLRE